MQDLRILGLEGLFFLSTPLEISRQGISSSISFALLIVNPEVIPWQFLSPSDLPRAQVFCSHEALGVVVIFKHEDFILAAFEVVLPSFNGFNNCQQFTIVSLIPSLSKNHLSGKKSYWMPSARIIQSQLTENSINSIARSIRFNSDRTLRIKII